jgi:hypothetical protein
MAAIYPRCRKKFMEGDINLLTDSVHAALTSSTYNSGHEFANSLSLIGSGVALTGKMLDAGTGVFDADNFDTPSPVTGVIVAVVIYKATGDLATSPLIAYMDGLSGLPLFASNQRISVAWPATGLFYV